MDLPIVPSFTIIKVKDTDNRYKVMAAAEMYNSTDLGKTYVWTIEPNRDAYDDVYDKEKKVLHIAVPNVFSGSKNWDMTYKDGKWTVNDIGLGCTYTMESYDKGLTNAQKALQDWAKKYDHASENAKFVDAKKK